MACTPPSFIASQAALNTCMFELRFTAAAIASTMDKTPARFKPVDSMSSRCSADAGWLFVSSP